MLALGIRSRRQPPAAALALCLLLFLGVFAKGGRAYCNLLCPVGALDALVNRLRGALETRPNDLQGNQLLSRNEEALGNYVGAYPCLDGSCSCR